MTIPSEAPFRTLIRLYCYLRHLGLSPQAALRRVRSSMDELVEGAVEHDLVATAREGLAQEPTAPTTPRPSAPPAIARGHLTYADAGP